jgi:hypothetical protein
MKCGIAELIGHDIEATAHWRRECAERYPDNDRNSRAADLLEGFAGEIESFENSLLHRRLETYLTDPEEFTLVVNWVLRSVGFSFRPDSCEDLLNHLIDCLSMCVKLPKLVAVK